VAQVIQALCNGKVVAVSDGSFKDYARAAAWTIKGDTTDNRVVGTGLTPGNAVDQSAYRSELFGLWGILASLKQFSEDNSIAHGHLMIACDGLSALKKAQSNYPTDPGEAHHDLISAIKNLRAALPLQISFTHIKGHQDQGLITALPRLAWMNIEMDALAKQKLSQGERITMTDQIPFKGWICRIEGQRVIKHLPKALYRHLNGKIILNHWATKSRFSAKATQAVNWASAEKAMNQLPQSKRQWVSKLAAAYLPDRKNMQRWGFRNQTKCPQCMCQMEDKDHIFKCPAELVVQQWTKALEDLNGWLESVKTHPQL